MDGRYYCMNGLLEELINTKKLRWWSMMDRDMDMLQCLIDGLMMHLILLLIITLGHSGWCHWCCTATTRISFGCVH